MPTKPAVGKPGRDVAPTLAPARHRLVDGGVSSEVIGDSRPLVDFTDIPVRYSAPVSIQPKLAVDSANSPLEREADQVAERILRMPASANGSTAKGQTLLMPQKPLSLQRKCARCDEEEELNVQRRGSPSLPEITPEVESSVKALQGRGQPLGNSVRSFFEPRFGCDFSQVRVHTQPDASATARALSAQAYTFGANIVFDSGRYRPDSASGRQLIAHELTHVVQQSGPASHQSTAGKLQRKEVPAPAKKPTLPKTKGKVDWKKCPEPRQPSCVFHVDFVNALTEALANMEQIPSPYAKGVAQFYKPLLGMIQVSGAMPQTYGIGDVTIPVTDTFSLKLPSIFLTLKQDANATTHAHYTPGSNAITVNEYTFGFMQNLDVKKLESTLYHEGIHLFEDLISTYNRDRRKKDRASKTMVPEFDESLTEPFAKPLSAAMQPIWMTYLASKNTKPKAAKRESATRADTSAKKMLGEVIARIEQEIYLHLREGKGFTATDLKSFKQDWLFNATYWRVPSSEKVAVQKFLVSAVGKKEVSSGVLPVIQKVQQAYINQRRAYGAPKPTKPKK